MSSSDGLDLAGVIGTWVAVFFAIVALVGILPAILYYKKTQTKKAQALALLDDPSGKYVLNTFRLANFRHRKIGRVTNLVSPPNLETLEYEPEWKSQLKKESASGWINFLYIINAAFPGRDSTANGDDRNLMFDDGETFLLVHRAWILVLAVVHCYAYRQDYGLPKDAPSHNHIEDFPWDKTVTGISGGLFDHSSATDDRSSATDERRDKGKLTFIMHPYSTPTILEGRTDIRALILLSFGYVKMTDGTLLEYQRTPRFFTRRIVASFKAVPVAELLDHTAHATKPELFSDMSLEVGKINRVSVRDAGDVFQDSATRWDANKMKRKGYINLGKLTSMSREGDIWLYRGDAHRLSAGYLSTPVRRHGFLYDKEVDLIVSKLFTGKHTPLTLRWGRKWVSKLDVKEDVRNLLTIALEKVSNSNLEKTSWSREAMQNLYDLDQAILMACKSSDWKFRSVSVLFLCGKRFRVDFAKTLEREEGECHEPIRFSIRNQKVELGGLDEAGNQHQAAFVFDFMSAFAFDEPPTSSDTESLPLEQAVFAALQGQIRAIMWKMSLSPRGVQNLLSSNVYYVSTRPARRARDLARPEIVPPDVDPETTAMSPSLSDEVAGSDSELSNRNAAPSIRQSQLEESDEVRASGELGLETLDYYGLELHTAVKRGDEVDVRRRIERGCNINARSPDGHTALFLAAWNGDLLIVQLLASMGADLDARDYNDNTPLSLAASSGQLSVVQFLLDSGADSEVRDKWGNTALFWTAQNGETATVEVLLEYGTDQDAQNNEGQTALWSACYYERLETIRVLLENGADCNIAQFEGATPLHVAAFNGNEFIVQHLLEKGADVSRRSGAGKTAFQIAVWEDHEAVCKLLEDWQSRIETGEDVENGRETDRQNPDIV